MIAFSLRTRWCRQAFFFLLLIYRKTIGYNTQYYTRRPRVKHRLYECAAVERSYDSTKREKKRHSLVYLMAVQMMGSKERVPYRINYSGYFPIYKRKMVSTHLQETDDQFEEEKHEGFIYIQIRQSTPKGNNRSCPSA